jgi:hypothetical protein
MKKITGHLILFFLFMSPIILTAQEHPYEGDIWKGDYFKGGYTDEDGNKIEITIYYKGHTNEIERKDSVVKYKNGDRFECSTRFIVGDTLLMFQYYYDASWQLRYERTRGFDEHGKAKSDDSRWLTPGGKPYRTREYDPKTEKYTRKEFRDGKWVEVEPSNPEKQENNEYIAQRSVSPTSRHSFPKLEFSANYSYLRAENGVSGLGMPLGVNLAGVYNFNKKLGLVADASYHYREKDDQKYDREYVMIGIEYDCDCCCCDDDPMIFTHALIGYGREGYQYMDYKNSNSGLIAAIGGGLKFRINRKVFIQLKTDAIANFFDEDHMQIDYRVGLGVGVNIGRRILPSKRILRLE